MNSITNHTLLEAEAASNTLRHFVECSQLYEIRALCHSEERQFFINKLCELGRIVITMPVTYETDGQGDQAIVYLHYFTPGADWYITERDVMRDQLQAFGKANLGYGGELGYISIIELLECGAELDLHWTSKKLAEV